MSNTEKVLDKVKKILAKVDGNNSQAESETALLMAQEILAKNGLSMNDIDFSAADIKEIVESECVEKGRLAWWYGSLAVIIANNFRCKVWSCRKKYSSTKLVFMGIKSDVELAKTVLGHVVSMIQYNSNNYIKEMKRINANLYEGYDSKAVNTVLSRHKNTYIKGYLKGLDDKFAEQIKKNDWGLILVVDPEVNKKFENMKFGKKDKVNATFTDSEDAQIIGYMQGKQYNHINGYMNSSEASEGA